MLYSSRYSGDSRLRFARQVFQSSFLWRGEVFDDEMKNYGETEELKKKSAEIKKKLQTLEHDLQNGWYMEIGFIGCGFKDDPDAF